MCWLLPSLPNDTLLKGFLHVYEALVVESGEACPDNPNLLYLGRTAVYRHGSVESRIVDCWIICGKCDGDETLRWVFYVLVPAREVSTVKRIIPKANCIRQHCRTLFS